MKLDNERLDVSCRQQHTHAMPLKLHGPGVVFSRARKETDL